MDIGVVVQPQATLAESLADFERVDALGVSSAWFAQTPTGPDAMTVLALAATRTRRVRLGTSVLATYPRHPLVSAAAARTVADVAEGRFVLGVSVGHRLWIENFYGLSFSQPVAHARDWVRTTRRLLDGEPLRAADNAFGINVPANEPARDVPIVLAATGPRLLGVGGEVSDGVLTWMCDAAFIEQVAVPAVARGAERAGRPAPPVIAGVLLCVTDDAASARAAVGERLAPLVSFNSYRTALDRVGPPGCGPEDVALIDTQDAVRAGLQNIRDAGAEQLVGVVLPDPHDPAASISQGRAVLAGMADAD